MRSNILGCALVALATLTATPSIRADWIGDLTREVRELVEAGQWKDAVDRIPAARQRCQSDPSRSCGTVLDYSEGYAWRAGARASAAGPDEIRQRLERAAAAYEKVRRAWPDHLPTRANLAEIYQRLGGLLVTKEPPDWRGGRRAYRKAIELAPSDPAPRQGLITLHRRMPIDRVDVRFLENLTVWEADFPGVVREGWEVVVKISQDSQPEFAERALLGWVRLLGNGDFLSALQARIAVKEFFVRTGLRSSETSELRNAVEELQEYLAVAETGEWPVSGWWSRTDDRQDALAALTLPMGRAWLLAERPDATAACWESARRFSVEGERAWLDLTTKLATLYSNHPDLQPGRLEELEDELFERKGDAYRTDDLAAIQRFHTVLGLIYSERGQWVSDHPYRNALFQLSRAIHTAEKRDDTAYEPLPYLKQLRADGLLAVSVNDTASRTFKFQAQEFLDDPSLHQPDLGQEISKAYLEASRAYLDSDAIEGAGQMLKRAKQIGLPPRERPAAEALDQLIRERSRAKKPLPTDAGPAPAPTSTGCTASAGSPAPRGVSESFWNRQQFRSLSDCLASGRSTDPDLDSARALVLAADDEFESIGASDGRRVQRAQQQVAEATGVRLEPTSANKGRSPPVTSRSKPSIDPSVEIGARVLTELGPGQRPKIRVRGDEVTVEPSESTSEGDRRRLADRVRRIPRVRSVKVKPEPPG